MNKVLPICLCIIPLLIGAMIGFMFFSGKAIAQGDGIIVDGADYISTTTNEYSADLINIAENVTPRMVVEYGDSISKLDLYESDDLNQAASIVSSRIIVEYVDSILECSLQSVTVPDITPRIIVEYADSIFSTDLERPSFGVEVSARIDSYSISPRNITVGGDVTIGFSFTNTGNVSWAFGAGATLRKPDGTRVDFLEAVTVNPGESGSAQWTHTIDMAGRWDTVFGVWKESTHPLENLLVQTGWVPEYITAVAVENQPPIANIEPDLLYEISSGKSVFFNGSNSEDPDGTIISYLWDFGDGTAGEGKFVNHRFRGAQIDPNTHEPKNKIYNVKLTVEDDKGATATDTVSVTVKPLEKAVEVSKMGGWAGMTASYNWVDEINGKDVYIVSKISTYSMGIAGTSLPSITRGDTIIWRDVLFILGIETKTYVSPFTPGRFGVSCPISKLTFPEGTFEGIEVRAPDKMTLLVRGLGTPSGIPGIPPVIHDEASTALHPDAPVETPTPMLRRFLDWIVDIIKLYSPGELRVYDLHGRVTGLVNTEVKEEILNSVYFNNTVVILSPSDSYRYEVVGIEDESYGLRVASIIEGESDTFTATDIPISNNAIHQYTINWTALSEGVEGVTVKVDSDGDGVFELIFTSDNELTQDEFMLQLPPAEAFPMWIVGAAVATIAIATGAIAVFWRKRKQPSTKRD